MKIRIERYLIRTADRTPAVLIDYHIPLNMTT
jgi:hypothetical protein